MMEDRRNRKGSSLIMKNKRVLNIVKKFAPEVTEVFDSKQDMSIRVTPRDINDKGIKNHQNCAVALACKRAFEADGVIVGTRTAYIIFGTGALRFRIPPDTSEQIKAFDKGKGFKVGVYHLDAPRKGEKLGDNHTGKTHNPSNRKRPTFNYHDREVRTTLR